MSNACHGKQLFYFLIVITWKLQVHWYLLYGSSIAYVDLKADLTTHRTFLTEITVQYVFHSIFHIVVLMWLHWMKRKNVNCTWIDVECGVLCNMQVTINWCETRVYANLPMSSSFNWKLGCAMFVLQSKNSITYSTRVDKSLRVS